MALYHFTDYRNIHSIKEFGLLSWPLVDSYGIDAIKGSNPLSRRLDMSKGFEEYVRLALRPKHPMLNYCLRDGRIKSAIWLTIDEGVLGIPGVYYSNTNAAATRAIINQNPNTAFHGEYDAEILIPKKIATNFILNI
jgi:hypothetical protein|tara:strand:+ start:194 stop:604 length:411 start_codon:yes stop_codon:yes gene_type:complete